VKITRQKRRASERERGLLVMWCALGKRARGKKKGRVEIAGQESADREKD
jgi:hypothetical protein